VPRGGGDHSSRAATLAARERERNVVELCLRGATFDQIGRQFNIDRSTAYKAWDRALKRLPKADVEALRKAQGERLQRMRGKLWTEIAGARRSERSDQSSRTQPGAAQ
jgi:DNA-binding NarL/FixJ family response regulator